MKTQIKISVQNVSNNHVHFERIIEQDTSISIPYDNLISSLLFLYDGLNVKVVIEQQQPFIK